MAQFRPKDDQPLAEARALIYMYYVYFAISLKNSKVYVGGTAKLPNDRVSDHNSGSNTWTKQNGPFKLLYYESYHCEKDMIAREKFYKSGFGKQIKKIIIENLGL